VITPTGAKKAPGFAGSFFVVSAKSPCWRFHQTGAKAIQPWGLKAFQINDIAIHQRHVLFHFFLDHFEVVLLFGADQGNGFSR
jgi:hypothetical protein